MTHHLSPLAALAGLVAVAGMSACGTLGGHRYTEDRSMTVAHVAGSAISVVNANGSVSVEEDDGAEVRVDVRLYSHDAERLAFSTLHADRMGDDSLHVYVEWPGGERQRNEGASIRVYVPDAAGVSVRTSNGSVHTAGLTGNADLTSSNGRIVVRDHTGPVYARTSNGSVRTDRIIGPVELYSSNGSVTISDAEGPVHAETSNAGISVHTSDENPGPVRVSTSNGSVTLNLGHAFVGRLRLGTSNGSIRVKGFDDARMIESRRGYIELSVGDDETVSAVKTSNGSVRVRGPEPSSD